MAILTKPPNYCYDHHSYHSFLWFCFLTFSHAFSTSQQLPWKPVKSIVAYYYMWKTTDRYQIQKRHRMIEKQNDLKEVIVHLRTSSNHNLSGASHQWLTAGGRLVPCTGLVLWCSANPAILLTFTSQATSLLQPTYYCSILRGK